LELPRLIGKEFAFLFYSGFAGRLVNGANAWLKRQCSIVLVYHRENDEMRDGVTVSREQFDRQMQLLRREYPVVPLEDIAKGRTRRDTRRPVVAVTFDDGYLDNFENALPILSRHHIPATFFVSTGFIGTDRGFDHDLRKLGRALPNMSWDQVRQMRRQGFGIGAHTVTHLNCARTPIEEVRRELLESSETLQHQLGVKDVMFAYPFGGKRDITAAVREEVRRAGYTACVSAYGGANRGPVDPFNILRVGIGSGLSLRGFRARIDGWARP
jgi:peptidoglycan/xylan/chitin deacetylase (PgdA/CDA1 family)